MFEITARRLEGTEEDLRKAYIQQYIDKGIPREHAKRVVDLGFSLYKKGYKAMFDALPKKTDVRVKGFALICATELMISKNVVLWQDMCDAGFAGPKPSKDEIN